MPGFDLTPSPNVLIALTQAPMQPLDALCELIDNAIDSFTIASLQGIKISTPIVAIDIPKLKEVESGTGILRIQDNGPGMSREHAEKAVRAGFSGKNKYDTLGLFGVGFNIATGKLGRKTKLLTCQKTDDQFLEILYDLEELVKRDSYQIPESSTSKQEGIDNGTFVEVSNWWPDGHQNHGFIYKLIRYGMPRIRKELGRRYSTFLKDKKIKIVVNGEECPVYEHCRWGNNRFLTRHKQQIPAVFHFDQLTGTQTRCTGCFALVPAGKTSCPSCKGSSFRTIEEKIRGWVGIQRYDHETDYGIDIIRNGRAIRVAEKNAFFEFRDEFRNITRDYPIDQPYGRIIGEVHLDHVPVDYLKQDFEKSSGEWQRAMSYLRGDSPLQPNKPGADTNNSYIFTLYQGYRRVRTPGKTDLYMGYYDSDAGKPKRISREIEKEYLKRFREREPGYYDDTEWYKLVEQADEKPLEKMIDCPECSSQNLEGSDICSVCGHVLIGKICINSECTQQIPSSAASCPHCGTNQDPEIETQWHCLICNEKNDPWMTECAACEAIKGAQDPLSKEYLKANSNCDDELSINGCSINLPDGSHSDPLDILVYITSTSIKPWGGDKSLPLIAFRGEHFEIFLDLSHPVFKVLHIKAEELVAAEIALYIHLENHRLTGGMYSKLFTVTSIQCQILETFWGDRLGDYSDLIHSGIKDFLQEIKSKLPEILENEAEQIFVDMDENQQKNLISNLIDAGLDIGELEKLKKSGQYLTYISNKLLYDLFARYPENFFDGKFWQNPYYEIPPGIPLDTADDLREKIRNLYLNCLQDIVMLREKESVPEARNARARLSLELLKEKVI